MTLRLVLKVTQEEAGKQCLAYAAKETIIRSLLYVHTLRTLVPACVRIYLPIDDRVLVYWPEEYCMSVVALTSITVPCPPAIGQDWVGIRVTYGSKYGALMGVNLETCDG